ncbi:MAG: hypothetical protein B7Y45_02410 [Sphingomonas sp. 28-66-16]|nr:MAG: hypothetical protein B7Y45_02410 [Sphingomonas sp. 28-66-16]
MRSTGTRLALALLALTASVTVAHAQTAAPHHPSSPVPNPQAGMPMPDATAPGSQPRTMGGDMGCMMATMRPMMPERGGMEMPFEHMEGRVAYLKAELQITDAQLRPWNTFADMMRANAIAMKAMHDGMMKDGMPSTTPERMAAQHKMMSARIGILERSEANTRALYASLSEEQRKAFDQMMVDYLGMM